MSAGERWPPLRILHLVIGVIAFYLFGRSGLFMDQELDHLVGMPDGARALYRSGHIYLLFTALLNLALGIYLTRSPSLLGRLAQYVGSAFLLAALYLFVQGFYVETPLAEIERPKIRTAIYFSLNGIGWHGVGALLLSRIRLGALLGRTRATSVDDRWESSSEHVP